MTESLFSRLAPFIQEYIYAHEWTELRDVQVDACRVLFGTDNHLILSAGTASGKTEAAFLPILTEIYETPPTSIGILYIGPTKALINDQFVRLEELLKEAKIPVWSWHGDVSASQKKNLFANPSGVLQITPESIEALLINKAGEIHRLFSDLRYVIVDEVHIFMNSERGRQVLCQLTRIERLTNSQPRRIGLSATLGDKELPEQWLKADTDRDVVTVESTEARKVRLSVEHFYADNDEAESQTAHLYEKYIFDSLRDKSKVLIFANSRPGVERIIVSLRKIAQQEHFPDIYHVHHGGISTSLRETAEAAMRNKHERAVTAATITLELGIDIGQLERVVQIMAPSSVSSFLQRLGRSGRRGDPSEMWFVSTEELPKGNEIFAKQLPWDLLQTIAIIQLYIEEKWIEPIRPIDFPFSLLYHQTMSILTSKGELSPPDLARELLTLHPFRKITTGQLQQMLRHLIETDHIERMESGGLIVGLKAERIVHNYHFFAVFKEQEEYVVRSKQGEIGRITNPPPVGSRMGLAGRAWEVKEINPRQRIIWAQLVQGYAIASSVGDGMHIHPKIIKRIKQVLFEPSVYRYLQPQAQQRLADARQMAQKHCIDKSNIIALGGNSFCVFPWMGTLAYRALLHASQADYNKSHGVELGNSPYYFIMNNADGIEGVRKNMKSLCSPNLALPAAKIPLLNKYDEYLPQDLLVSSYLQDEMDFEAMRESLLCI